MTVLAQVAAEAGARTNHGSAKALRAAVQRLPDDVEVALTTEDSLKPLAELSVERQSYVVGGGPSEVAALEAALEAVIKAREAAYVRVDGMPLEQFIHGPMVCLEPRDVVMLVNVPGGASGRNAEAAPLFTALESEFWVIGSAMDGYASIGVPETLEVLSPTLTMIPMQLWAWHMATIRGIDPDTFRKPDPRFEKGLAGIKL